MCRNHVTSYIFSALLAIVLLNVQARSYYKRNDYSSRNEDEQENSLSPISSGDSHLRRSPSTLRREIIKITSSTEGLVTVKQGEPIMLECSVVGSYLPSVDWYKDDDLPVTHGEDNNYITKFSVSRITVRYIVDCAQRKHEGTYTCGAMSGSLSTTSPPATVIVSDKMTPKMLSNGGKCREDLSLPRIIRFNTVLMHLIGTDAKLYCRTQGFPRPYVYWTDKHGNVLDTSAGSRYKVLENGDLIIRKLRWPDMGVYMCNAENSVGKDITSTFVYPMLDETSDSQN